MSTNIVLLFTFAACSWTMNGQTTTTMTDIGKVGSLHFSLTKSDTVNLVSIAQNSPIGMRVVMFTDVEIPEVVQMLKTFSEQTSKKPAGQTVTQYNTKNLLLSCSYFKDGSWLILVQNSDPKFQQSSDDVKTKTGYQIYHFVEIKPKQIAEVVKIFSKIAPVKPA